MAPRTYVGGEINFAAFEIEMADVLTIDEAGSGFAIYPSSQELPKVNYSVDDVRRMCKRFESGLLLARKFVTWPSS